MKLIGGVSQIAVVCALIGLAACGAARPTKYYVLDAHAAAPAAPVQYPVRLIVARVVASHLYRDDRLVYGTGPLELGTYEYERWSEPPVDMIQDLLVSSLRSSGQYSSVSRIGSSSRGDYIVRSRLEALDEVDKPSLAARFSIQVELFEPSSGAIVWSTSYSHDEPVQGKKVEDVVQALDTNVQAGMQQVTSGIAQYLATRAAR